MNFTNEMKVELLAINHIANMMEGTEGNDYCNEQTSSFADKYDVDVHEVVCVFDQMETLMHQFENRGINVVIEVNNSIGNPIKVTVDQFAERWMHPANEFIFIASDENDWQQVEKIKSEIKFMATKRFYFHFLIANRKLISEMVSENSSEKI